MRELINKNRTELQQQQEQAHISLINAVEQKLSEITNLVNYHSEILNNILQQTNVQQYQHTYVDNRPYHYIKAEGVPSKYDEQKPMSAYSTQKPQSKRPPKNTAASFREELRRKAEEELKKQQATVNSLNKDQQPKIKEIL